MKPLALESEELKWLSLEFHYDKVGKFSTTSFQTTIPGAADIHKIARNQQLSIRYLTTNDMIHGTPTCNPPGCIMLPATTLVYCVCTKIITE
jgi:hypothetical protein